MTHPRGVHLLAEQIGLDVQHVARGFETARHAHDVIRTSYSNLTDEQFARLVHKDRFPIVIVANYAMRFAGRIEDAQLLMDIYKASTDTAAYLEHLRPGVGAHPDDHGHPQVAQAIRILRAADLPPVEAQGEQMTYPGFQVMPCDIYPGVVFISRDPDCETRTGFAGGRDGYDAVMRWAGWSTVPVPVDGADFVAACHPDYVQRLPFAV